VLHYYIGWRPPLVPGRSRRGPDPARGGSNGPLGPAQRAAPLFVDSGLPDYYRAELRRDTALRYSALTRRWNTVG